MEDVLESWTAVLFGDGAEAVVEAISRCGSEVHIAARGTAHAAACPGCGAVSSRVHDVYHVAKAGPLPGA